MLGKVITGFVIVSISSGLIYGAINRTVQREVLPQNGSESNDVYPLLENRAGEGDGGGQGDQNGRGYESDDLRESLEDRNLGSGDGEGNGYRGGQNKPQGSAGITNPGTGLAVAAGEWIEVSGTILTIESDLLQIQTSENKVIEIEGRSVRFAIEEGFTAFPGNQIMITGFYEGDDFEAAILENLETGASVTLRDENGRPLWAGRGRGKG